MLRSLVPVRFKGLLMARACESKLAWRRNPPSGNGLLSFHVSRFCDTRFISTSGTMLFGNGVLFPGGRIARDAPGFASRGYQRFPGCRNSEKSPPRIASVGTEPRAGVARLSRRASQLKSQNVLSRFNGPETTVPY